MENKNIAQLSIDHGGSTPSVITRLKCFVKGHQYLAWKITNKKYFGGHYIKKSGIAKCIRCNRMFLIK